LTFARAREFEQMQEFPPPHFFSSINFEGYPLPVFQAKRSPAPEWQNEVKKRSTFELERVRKRSGKSKLRSSATFVPFAGIPPATLVL